MIDIRRFEDLGHFESDWLSANYHFSFSGYRDPARMGAGALRVWNDDTIQPGTGFPPHGHENMEIITYVRKGAITHKDSLGNAGRTEAGNVQIMSAASGIQHAEWNAEPDITQLYQLWIQPDSTGGDPSWGMREFPKHDRAGAWAVFASANGESDSLKIRQDAKVLGATLQTGQSLTYEIGEHRHGYLVVAEGEVKLNGDVLKARDGAQIDGLDHLKIEAIKDAELVLVDTV